MSGGNVAKSGQTRSSWKLPARSVCTRVNSASRLRAGFSRRSWPSVSGSKPEPSNVTVWPGAAEPGVIRSDWPVGLLTLAGPVDPAPTMNGSCSSIGVTSRAATSGWTSALRIGAAFCAFDNLPRSISVTIQPRTSTTAATTSTTRRIMRARWLSGRLSAARAERRPSYDAGPVGGVAGVGVPIVVAMAGLLDLHLDGVFAVDLLEASRVDLGRLAVEHQ